MNRKKQKKNDHKQTLPNQHRKLQQIRITILHFILIIIGDGGKNSKQNFSIQMLIFHFAT